MEYSKGLVGGNEQLERIKVLVVEDDPEKRALVIDYLSNVEYMQPAGAAGTAEEALETAETAGPDVALIGSLTAGDGYRLAEEFTAAFPWMALIMMEEELKEETMRKAIFAGAGDVLIFPFTPARLIDAIYRGYQLEKKQLMQREALPALSPKARQGRIITVFSPKGGVGKTFVSTNLAVSLARRTGEKVALVDLDLDFGNTALALNIIPRYTIADLINEIHSLDQDLLESYLLPHHSGIQVLAANDRPQAMDFINAEHIALIIKALQSIFDYVVIDMPARFQEAADPAFQQSDLLMLIATQEVSAIRNIKAGMLFLESRHFPRHKIKLILNKAESHSEVKFNDVKTTLNQNLYGILPAEYRLVSASLNKGIPVVQLSPRARVSRSFGELTRRILGNGLKKERAAGSQKAAR